MRKFYISTRQTVPFWHIQTISCEYHLPAHLPCTGTLHTTTPALLCIGGRLVCACHVKYMHTHTSRVCDDALTLVGTLPDNARSSVLMPCTIIDTLVRHHVDWNRRELLIKYYRYKPPWNTSTSVCTHTCDTFCVILPFRTLLRCWIRTRKFNLSPDWNIRVIVVPIWNI